MCRIVKRAPFLKKKTERKEVNYFIIMVNFVSIIEVNLFYHVIEGSTVEL